DLGATLCTRTKPQCDQCPLSANCQAYAKGTVLNYPTPKPKKIKPVKSLVFLLLYHKKKLLLEKRAPTGIWGGLYSLPEFSNTEAVQDWCLANNIKIQTKKNLTPLRHTFSHYHLDYSPLVITCGNPKNIVMENKEALWYNSAKIKTLALPAPIKKLIQHNNGY
ncbi:MAG: NUDIX domain-containing protein, partial [Methylococcales bacterium]|nr:NUDIX domain-containing protein [Methylococcales bacterium]